MTNLDKKSRRSRRQKTGESFHRGKPIMKTELKSKDPQGRCLYDLLYATFEAWDEGVIRAKEYDTIAQIILDRIQLLRKEKKIGAYYARRIEETQQTNMYLVHDIIELD